ncbi:pantetheine-phosphate adenylyltransferase [Lactobacillus sp. ESL0677]|uniref:pantetheine-phosphate adenylyltransferase n=1 Tax=Lactobacillus sp. ESL0677 TaxID=2983208 RepID=UPI0023F6CEFB|nr:pantetheine-phosphate adenylyltransferase [Lactobacillus sp. ESL0677]WEV37824.1 pantetheine-phosphate adenylyltransferase [Lactobacillus sp. ESL0677]
MTAALFPGSFDPITNGHVGVIKQAAGMFDKLYVVVMTNMAKKYLFTVDERVAFAQDALKDCPNVEVLKRPEDLTVNVARELHAKAIVRGVRNSSDFLYEQEIAAMNKKMVPDVATVLLFTKPEDSFVASSIIKEVAHFHGDISAFLPKMAAEAVKQKLG